MAPDFAIEAYRTMRRTQLKGRFVVPIIALLALGGPIAFAQTPGGGPPQQPPTAEELDQRFQQMNTMMGEAQKAQGTQRMELMQKHMELMEAQMKAMRPMMGGGMMAGMNAGQMETGGRGYGAMLSQMQARMDMMQQMMEHTLDQQKMMMQSAPTK